MTNSDTYRNNEREKDPLSLFDGGSVLWDKSKEDIWAEMDALLEHEEEGKVVSLTRRSRLIAAAALIVLLLGVPGVMRFYSKTIQSDAGEHLAILLPDNSEVNLNALTTIQYNPLWWRFNREVKLEGEAFFNVEPGSEFEVISQAASTMVVGTSFNIVARDKIYEVTCITGKVKVSTGDMSSDITLTPNQKAILGSTGALQMHDIQGEQSISWIDNEFFFTSHPLGRVIDEIERQFNISIELKLSNELFYTGNFSRESDPEQVLDLVCKAFGIKFEATAKGTYLITKDEE